MISLNEFGWVLAMLLAAACGPTRDEEEECTDEFGICGDEDTTGTEDVQKDPGPRTGIDGVH